MLSLGSAIQDVFSGAGSIINPNVGNMGTTNIPYGGMSPEERQYFDMLTGMTGDQRNALQQQLSEYNNLKPELYSGVRGLDTSGADLNQAFAGRTLSALRGELPTDPTLLRQMQLGDIDIDNALRKQLGTGYETSTPGIQAMNDWRQRKAELVYGANQNQMNQGFQNYLSGTSNLFTRQLQQVGALGGIPSGSLPFISAGNSLTGAAAAPFNTLAQQQLGNSGVSEKYFGDQLDYRGSMMKSIASLFGSIYKPTG